MFLVLLLWVLSGFRSRWVGASVIGSTLELRMRAAWRLITWTIGFLMGTRNLADWWQVLIGLERTSQQQKRPHCRQKAVILLDVGCRCVLPWQGAGGF